MTCLSSADWLASPQKPESRVLGFSSEEIRLLSPAPLGKSPFGEDPAVAEAAGRLPMGARASLVHVVVQRRFVCCVGVLEVSGSVLEGGY